MISYAYDPGLWCPECDCGFKALAWVIVDDREEPAAWAKCRLDTIHCFRCVQGHPQRIQAPLLLHDSGARRLFYSQTPIASPAQAQQEFISLMGRSWDALPDELRQVIRERVKLVRRELLPLAMAGADDLVIDEVEQIYQVTSTPLIPGEEEARIEAIKYALSLFESEHAPMLWATLAGRLAESIRRSGVGDPKQNLAEAKRISELILRELKTHDEPLRVAIAEMNLGVLYGDLSKTAENHRTALELLRRAHEVFRPRLFPQYCANVCNNLAIQYMKGDPAERAADIEAAIEALQEGIAVLTPESNPTLWGELHQHLGISYYHRVEGDAADNIEKSIAGYGQALLTRTQAVAPREWVLTQMDLGNALLRRIKGDLAENIDDAINTYQRAAEFAYQNDFRFDWARLQYDLSNAYLLRIRGNRQENAERAITAGEAALREIRRESRPDDWGNVQQNLGNAYRELAHHGQTQLWDKAIECYRHALSVRSAEISRNDWLASLDNLAGSCSEAGGHQEEVDSLAKQIDEAIAVGPAAVSPRVWAAFLVNAGTSYRDRVGDEAENCRRAKEVFRTAIQMSSRFGMYEILRRAVLRLSLLRERLGEWEDSYAELSAARTLLEQAYAGAVSDEGKDATADSNWLVYQRLAHACVRTGRTQEAFLNAEQGNARVLRDELAQLPIPALGVPQYLLDEESALLDRLRIADLLLRRTDEQDARAKLTAELQAVRERLNKVWDKMSHNPEAQGYVKSRRGEPLRWDEIHEWLTRQGSPTAIVEFADLSKQLHAFIVRTGDVEPQVVALDLPEADLLRLVTKWTEELLDPRAGRGSAEDLANRLLAPILPHLLGSSVVCFVPLGLLHYIPLHSLTVDGKILLEHAVVQYAPSAAAAMQKAQGPAQGAMSAMAVAGNPTGDLPFAEIEAAAVARRFRFRALLRDEASAKAVIEALSKADRAHLAAHAWFDQSDPLASGILLAGRTVLDARRAMHEKLRLKLLVLSACSTGQHMVRVSNSISGLARGFLYAGVRQLVLSLWPVNDLSTMLLMDRFHCFLEQGLTAGQALRQAQLDLRAATNATIARQFAEERRRAPKDRELDEATASYIWRRFTLADPNVRPFEHPHYWSPFFVTGAL